jgi:hypothetical protein
MDAVTIQFLIIEDKPNTTPFTYIDICLALITTYIQHLIIQQHIHQLHQLEHTAITELSNCQTLAQLQAWRKRFIG